MSGDLKRWRKEQGLLTCGEAACFLGVTREVLLKHGRSNQGFKMLGAQKVEWRGASYVFYEQSALESAKQRAADRYEDGDN